MDGDSGETLPDDLREWVDERAEREGVEPVTVLTRAVNTYRLAVGDSGASLDDLDSVSERLDAVEGRVDGLEDSLDEKVDDVRMRVVQVKRETDEKAPRDHDHEQLHDGLGRVRDDVETVRDRLSELESHVDAGFDNYEEVLTYLDEATTDLDDHLRVVAQSLVNLRSRAADVEAAEREREALSELLRTANDAGDRKATCDRCGETVHLDLLSEPRCPACRSMFDELTPSKGFFGSATLHTGTPPQLEAAPSEVGDVTSLFDQAVTTPEARGTESDTVTDSEPESAADVDFGTTHDDSTHDDEQARQPTANGEHDDD